MKASQFALILIISVSCNNSNNQGIKDEIEQPESLNLSISCELIDNWERAKVFTKQYLEAMPEEHYDFRPTPEILPFAHEFLHVACVNFRYAAMIAGGDDCGSYEDIYNDPNLQSKQSVIRFVMDSYDAMIDRLTQESDLSEPTYYYRWSCSKECLSIKGFEHQSHHRGKAAIYLRLKGIAPPPHMLIEDWSIPKDITEEEWMNSEDHKSYKSLINTN